MISELRSFGFLAICLGLFLANGVSALVSSTTTSATQDTFPCVHDQCRKSQKQYCDGRENKCRSCQPFLQKYFDGDFSPYEPQCVKYYTEDLSLHYEEKLKNVTQSLLKSQQAESKKSQTIQELKERLASETVAVEEYRENLSKKQEQLQDNAKELAEAKESVKELKKELAKQRQLLQTCQEKDARFIHGSGAEILLLVLLVIISAAAVVGYIIYRKCSKKPDEQDQDRQSSQGESAKLLNKKNKEESTSDYSLSTVSGGEDAAPKDGDEAECPSRELEEVKVVQDAKQKAVCENGKRVQNQRYDASRSCMPRTEMAPEQDFQELCPRANHDNSVQSLNYHVPNTESEPVDKNSNTKTPAINNIININFDTDKNVSGNRDKGNSSNGAGNTELCGNCKSESRNDHSCQRRLGTEDTNCSARGCPLAQENHRKLTSVNPTTPEDK